MLHHTSKSLHPTVFVPDPHISLGDGFPYFLKTASPVSRVHKVMCLQVALQPDLHDPVEVLPLRQTEHSGIPPFHALYCTTDSGEKKAQTRFTQVCAHSFSLRSVRRIHLRPAHPVHPESQRSPYHSCSPKAGGHLRRISGCGYSCCNTVPSPPALSR